MDEHKPEITNNLPLIGDRAPSFVANTTNGIVKFPEDYRGKWVILFSHPMDFTPVCTSEFITFQSMISDFEKLNTEIIGLSVGAIFSHLAWFKAIYDDIKFNGLENTEINFPVIEDLDLHISKLYGMIHPNTSETKTVRAVFIIDTDGIIRTILYYPQTTGRNIKEIKRVLIALQTSDIFDVSTPANWVPGQPVILPAPRTNLDMKKRLNSNDKNLDIQAWFFTLQNLPELKIYRRVNELYKRHKLKL